MSGASMLSAAVALIAAVSFCSLSVVALRPIVLVHGLHGNNVTYVNTKNFILTDFPDANITEVTAFDGVKSLQNMWIQVSRIYQLIQPVLDKAPDGVTLICYSQGGLVCRGIIQTYSNHNVHTFISLSAPMMGQFGVSSELTKVFPSLDREQVYKIAYTGIMQMLISIANYWNDPFHQHLYLKYCTFLPVLNNVTHQTGGFQAVKQLVLVGGPDDEVITPWQSSQFGFYPQNSTTFVTPMKSQPVYQHDVFGLQTLDTAGNLSLCEVAGVQHQQWPDQLEVFTKCVKPWLN